MVVFIAIVDLSAPAGSHEKTSYARRDKVPEKIAKLFNAGDHIVTREVPDNESFDVPYTGALPGDPVTYG